MEKLFNQNTFPVKNFAIELNFSEPTLQHFLIIHQSHHVDTWKGRKERALTGEFTHEKQWTSVLVCLQLKMLGIRNNYVANMYYCPSCATFLKDSLDHNDTVIIKVPEPSIHKWQQRLDSNDNRNSKKYFATENRKGNLPVSDWEYILTILSSFLITAAVIRPDMAPSCTVANRRAGRRLPAKIQTHSIV